MNTTKTWMQRAHRWWGQFKALWEKNVLTLKWNMLKMISCIIIPSLLILILFLSNYKNSIVSTTTNIATPSPLQGLGDCDVFYSEDCLQIAYTPSNSWTKEIMDNVVGMNNVTSSKGFDTSTDLQVGFSSCLFRPPHTNTLIPILSVRHIHIDICSIQSW